MKFNMAKSSILALVLCALAAVSAVTPCAPKAPAAPSIQSAPANAVAAPPPDQRQESANDAINAEQVCEMQRQQDQVLASGKISQSGRALGTQGCRPQLPMDSFLAHILSPPTGRRLQFY
jgi:hypothetical protein